MFPSGHIRHEEAFKILTCLQVGVGCFVLNERQEVLLVQEKSGPLRGMGVWKMVTGLVDAGEDIVEAAAREVIPPPDRVSACRSSRPSLCLMRAPALGMMLQQSAGGQQCHPTPQVLEETGVRATPSAVLALRQAHGFAFGKSDFFFVVALKYARPRVYMGIFCACSSNPLRQVAGRRPLTACRDAGAQAGARAAGAGHAGGRAGCGHVDAAGGVRGHPLLRQPPAAQAHHGGLHGARERGVPRHGRHQAPKRLQRPERPARDRGVAAQLVPLTARSHCQG